MIDLNKMMSDFNLHLYLGSCWVNTSRDTRLDTILDTIPDTKIRTWTKESRSIDRAENWESHGAERKGVSTQSQAEINSFKDEDPTPVPITYWRRISSWTISTSSTYTSNQDQLCNVCRFVAYGPDTIFSTNNSILMPGNEVRFIFIFIFIFSIENRTLDWVNESVS
jgi:hypothetical protein